MTPVKAAIIGSGIAGLAGAIRLALQGIQVTVFEKNNYAGGKLGHFAIDGYHFDTGPSLFVQPENIEELFTLAEEDTAAYFTYKPLPVACNYFYEDGLHITGYANAVQLAEELLEKAGEPIENTLTYLQQSARLYDAVSPVFLQRSLHKSSTYLTTGLLKAFGAAKWKYLFQTLNEVNTQTFSTDHAIQLFNRYATYNGSNPYKAPGMLSLIPHIEYNQGIYYPHGGMISIVDALYRLALKKGVQFIFDSQVQNIQHKNGKVTGIFANDTFYPASVVVSNADVYNTYKFLLNDDVRSNTIEQQERSSSAFVFYWGIGKSFEQLGLHNIFFSNDYKKEFEHIFYQKELFNDPTIYINITAKCEPGVHAPEGKENWFVMINVPADTGQDWDVYRQKYKRLIIDKLSRLLQTDIEKLVETESVLDPLLIETKTGSFKGALYGSSSNNRMSAFLRHPNFSNKISGLYFAGGTVHPGGGIPLCLKSARIMSELVATDIKDL